MVIICFESDGDWRIERKKVKVKICKQQKIKSNPLTLVKAESIPPANDIFFHVTITTCFGMNVSAPTTPSRISHITRSRTSTPNLSVRVCKSRSCLHHFHVVNFRFFFVKYLFRWRRVFFLPSSSLGPTVDVYHLAQKVKHRFSIVDVAKIIKEKKKKWEEKEKKITVWKMLMWINDDEWW